ncbi:hypothetical protein PAAG_01799 [Paracoccidioides lutzii Pb01]|uniref:Uncharacterized protein n=1 Tax=Paracoccidioides lutzii (strain ATCC MYA-826 / Pb01) TaxID=502779 RepID=C1GTF4_PARBA|nr:hypothetical protein PAAG_01799 [Paracoccidioides lutzii Pb01]EEH39610.1 hypothetical protein PAAG_01799 [Paracoccidioides lutzii Pb01]
MSLLQKFQDSMESVYGKFSDVSDITQWTPPPNSGGHRGRYLWKDAFGVLNFLTLFKETSLTADNKAAANNYLLFAQRLIATVHDVLGSTRDGNSRLPDATDEEPLRGGLRIGKEEETGPNGDGQYFHYLTMWMFALNRMSIATGDPSYNRQAVSLAKAIHPHFFLNRASERPHMVWKVSMDLSRPLVASEGNLDPIDGYVVFRLLQASALKYGDGAILEEEIGDYKRVMTRKGDYFVTRDPLDLGMTLWTAHWFAEREKWARDLSNRCVAQLRGLFDENHFLESNLQLRLAFREFGSCLGIGCLTSAKSSDVATQLNARSNEIITQWQNYISSSLTPDDLKPITRVMYSTALIPGAFKSRYLGDEPIDHI